MKKRQKQALAVGAGAAALAAAAAGVYFLTGKQGAKTRKKVSALGAQAKREVVKELRSLQKVGRANYNDVVDKVTKRYKTLKKVDASELAALASELKGHWNSISKQVNALGTKPAKKSPAKKKAPAKKKKR